MKTNYQEVQEAEMESLQSIFGDDFQRISVKTVWNVENRNSCSIKVRPSQQELKEHVSILLIVSMTPRYPDAEPIISLNEAECATDVNDLLEMLLKLAKERVGMEMIYDLYEVTSEFLNTHFNSATMIAKGYQDTSLLDNLSQRQDVERIERQKQIEMQRRQRQESFDQSIRKELEFKSTLVKTRSFNSVQFKLQYDGTETESYFWSQKVVTSMEEVLEAPFIVYIYPWKQYLYHARDDNNLYILIKFEELINANITDNNFEIPVEVNRLKKTLDDLLRQKTEILPFVNYQITLYPKDDFLKLSIKILLKRKKSANYASLSDLLLTVHKFSYEDLKLIFYDLVDQFRTIHSNGFYYKNQDPEYIIFEDDVPCLLFPYYLRDIFKLSNYPVEHLFESETCPPELTSNPQAQPTTVSDTWSFAILLCTFLLGDISNFKFRKLRLRLESKHFPAPSHFQELILRCLGNDPRDRPTFSELQRLEWRGRELILNDIYKTISNDRIDTEPSGLSPNAPSTFISPTSRYLKDFEELSVVGKGGFGVVVKAQNKLDGRIYAIKKIKLFKNNSSYKQITREIRSLSQIDSNRCVRYYHSWLEPYESSPNSKHDSDSSETEDLNVARKSLSIEIEFDYAENQDAWISPQASMLKRSPESSILSVSDSSNFEDNKKEILFIQMEFCDNLSLRDAIDKNMNPDDSWRILQQITEALNHIHSLGIIHRDLNPRNIFIDKNGNCKLGDFGLSTFVTAQVQQNIKSNNSGEYLKSHSKSKSMSHGVGTRLYIAPETMTKSKKSNYTAKVDMYSLGIILFELIHPFSTMMERVFALEALRSTQIQFPSDFDSTKYKTQTSLIKTLLSHDPNTRPSSSDLLNSGLFPNSIEAINVRKASEIVLNGGPTGIRQVVSELLKRKVKDFKDYTYDIDANTTEIFDQLPILNQIQQYLRKVFQNRGAIEYRPPILMPYSNLLLDMNIDKSGAFLVDSAGMPVVLTYDLSFSLSRIIAKTEMQNRKLYMITDVFRNSAALTQPRQIPQAVYAMIGEKEDPDFAILSVLESLSIIFDIMINLKIGQKWYVCINHISILDAILQFITGNDDEKITSLKSVLHLLPSNRFNIKDLPNLTNDQIIVNMLEKYNLKLDSVKNISLPFFKLTRHILMLSDLIEMCFGNENIVWNPILAPTTGFSDDLFFQVYIEKDDNKTLIASIGESCTDIISKFGGTKTFNQSCFVLKFSLPIFGKFATNFLNVNLDVIITSFSNQDSFKERFLIAKLLRDNKITCELWMGDSLAFDQNSKYCNDRNCRYILYVKTKLGQPILKLKDIVTKSEREITQESIISELKALLGKNTDSVQFSNAVHFEKKKSKKPVHLYHEKVLESCQRLQSLPIFVVDVTYKEILSAFILNEIPNDDIKFSVKQVQLAFKSLGQLIIHTIDNQILFYPIN
eukprot:NODE_315_length_9989_cov_0.656825.p1 type:complete len:1431 gc:universal NODE_315_length_9989_cov_0.656825:4769-9061(+)